MPILHPQSASRFVTFLPRLEVTYGHGFNYPPKNAWNGRYVRIGSGGNCGYNPFLSTCFAIDEVVQSGHALGIINMGVPNSTANLGPVHKNIQMRISLGIYPCI
jgi:hypothetical protein